MTKEVQELLCTFSNLFYVYRWCKYYSNENPEKKRSFRKFSFGWEGDFKMDKWEREWEVVDWFIWPRIETVGVLWVQGKQTTLESRKRPGISWAAELLSLEAKLVPRSWYKSRHLGTGLWKSTLVSSVNGSRNAGNHCSVLRYWPPPVVLRKLKDVNDG